MPPTRDTLPRCEAVNKRGRRCALRGEWDSYHFLVLCPLHLNYYETVLVSSRRDYENAMGTRETIEERL